MRRFFVVSALIAGLMSLSMPTAWAVGRDTARVEGLRGTSSVRTSNSAAWQNLEGRLDLTVGSTLRTSQDSEALVSLPGDVVLRVAPGSELEVSRLDGRNLELNLESGRLFASVPAQHGNSTQLQVQTPAGLAVSSGAEFTLQAGEQTSLRVISGSARLAGQTVTLGEASAQALEVPAGTEAVAQNGQQHDNAKCDCQDEDCPCQSDAGKCNTDQCTTWKAAHGGASTGGTFPVFAVLGGLGLLGIIALLISDSSDVQSK